MPAKDRCHVAKPALVAVAFFVKPCIQIGIRLMRLIAAFLAFEVARGVAYAVARRLSTTFLSGEALD